MEVKIGIQNVGREIVFESKQSADEINAAVAAALKDSSVLNLADSKGRQVFVPAAVLGYVEVGPEEQRKVGFGAL